MKACRKGLTFYLIADNNRSVCGVAEVEPFFEGHIHTHKEPEYYKLLKGKGILYINGTMHEFKAGEEYYIPGNVPHAFIALENKATLYFEFFIGPLAGVRYKYSSKTLKSELSKQK